MSIGTIVVKKAVKGTVGEVADTAIDKGPMDRMEDKLEDKTEKMKRKAVKKVL